MSNLFLDLASQVRTGIAFALARDAGGTGRDDGLSQGIVRRAFVGGTHDVDYGDAVCLVSAVDSSDPVIDLASASTGPVYGIVLTAGTTPSLGRCDVLVAGVHPALNTSGSVTRLHAIVPSATAGSGEDSGGVSIAATTFAIALASVTGAGTVPVSLLQAVGSGAGGGSLIVREDDGTPSVSDVTEIVVSNGTLTNLGGGSVSVTTGAGGGGGSDTYDSYIASISSIVHRWQFEEASGSLTDAVGSLTLAPAGSPVYSQAGLDGNAVKLVAGARFDSSGLGSIPVGADARTFVCVFKTTGYQSGKQTLMSYGTSGSTRQWWTGYLNDGSDNALSLAVWSDDLVWTGRPSGDGQWHLAAWGYNGDRSIYTYSDGAVSVRTVGAALNTGSSGNFRVGLDSAGSNQLLATIDDLAVFSTWLGVGVLDKLYRLITGTA